MRRSDAGLAAVVGVMGVFVAWQVVSRRPSKSDASSPAPASRTAAVPAATAPSPAATQQGAAPASAENPSSEIATATVKTDAAAPARDLAQIRALVTETPGTYMSDMIADLDGRLVRWPDKRQEGLRIWVQTSSQVANWNTQYAQMARDVFDDWGRDAELPIRFDFVLDSATADIRVVWSDRFPPEAGQRVGVTRRTTDQFGWIVGAEIQVAIHDSTGRTIPPDHLGGIVRHEAGHALGMGHSRDPRTKMYPTEIMSAITSADRATLRLLYRLPPGVAR